MLAFWHYFYVPAHGPFWTGNVWGNVFVVAIAAPLGWLWAHTKFWPLRPIRHGIEGLHRKVDERHARADAHDEWVAQHLAALHRAHIGEPAPHPHFTLPPDPGH